MLLFSIMADKGHYDAFVNDSDLIGTHTRSGWALSLTDFMAGQGRDVTLPTLDLDDFLGISFVTGMDGDMYQLPDQQFANLYWFRYDWFQRPELQRKFRDIYGYDLGVPVNWSAYEDIAEFARKAWTPTGLNVPNYPKLAKLWWPNIADAIDGKRTPQEALDRLAESQDRAMAVMQRNYTLDNCGPRLADRDQLKGRKWWFSQPGAPKPKLANEKPPGQTIPYDELLKAWRDGRVQ